MGGGQQKLDRQRIGPRQHLPPQHMPHAMFGHFQFQPPRSAVVHDLEQLLAPGDRPIQQQLLQLERGDHAVDLRAYRQLLDLRLENVQLRLKTFQVDPRLHHFSRRFDFLFAIGRLNGFIHLRFQSKQ